MQKILLIFFLLLGSSFAYGNAEDETSETQSFIDKGKVDLPVAPEVITNKNPKSQVDEPLNVQTISESKNPAQQTTVKTLEVKQESSVQAAPKVEEKAQAKEQAQEKALDNKKAPENKIQAHKEEGQPMSKVKTQEKEGYKKTKENITEHAVKAVNKKHHKDKVVDQKQEQFIKDEALLLMFPDDDIICGELTYAGHLDILSGSEYIVLATKNIPNKADIEKAKLIKNFIAASKTDKVPLSNDYILSEATEDIKLSKITDLRTLANNYNLVDLEDEEGSNLLHIASLNNNSTIAKWLIMRGFDINKMNIQGSTPLDIAGYYQYWQVLSLLESAGAH